MNTNKLSDIENIALKLEAVNTNIDKFFKDMENIILELQAVGTKSSIQKANRIAYYINIAKNGIIAIESLKTDKK
jgi:hypothetical protein